MTKRLLFLFAALSLGACNLDIAQPTDSPTDPATESFAPATGVDLTKMTRMPNGVYYQDLEVGTGDSLTTLRIVSVVFVAYLRTGFVFDHLTQPRLYDLHSVGITGFVDGIIGMRVGGTRKLVLPSSLGFGPLGAIGLGVPGNSTLVYDVTLVEIP
jgi:FKBP-type peptidyl-prolyl cis-trans isomerase